MAGESTSTDIPIGWMRAAGLLAGGLIAMQEADRLLGQVLGEGGATSTAPWTISPAGPSHGEAWTTWAGASNPALTWLAGCRLEVGWVFTVFLLLVLGRLAGFTDVRSLWPFGAHASSPIDVLRRLTWHAAALLKVAELVATAIAIGRLDGKQRSQFEDLIPWMTWLTWLSRLAIAALVLLLLGRAKTRKGLWRNIVRWALALWHHRLSLLVVAVVSLLALVPGPNLLDQFPDVLRAWVGDGWRGARHAAFAVAAMVGTSALLLVLGRLRSERDRLKYDRCQPTPWHSSSPWYLLGPVLALGAALALRVAHSGDLVYPRGLFLAVMVPLALWSSSEAINRYLRRSDPHPSWRPTLTIVATILILGSTVAIDRYLPAWPSWQTFVIVGVVLLPGVLLPLAVRVLHLAVSLFRGPAAGHWGQESGPGKQPAEPSATATATAEGERPECQKPECGKPRRETPPGGRDVARAELTLRTGDLLAAAVLVVGGLALVRAFTAPALLRFRGGPDAAGAEGWWALAAVLFGFSLAVTWPWAAHRLLGQDELDRLLPLPRIRHLPPASAAASALVPVPVAAPDQDQDCGQGEGGDENEGRRDDRCAATGDGRPHRVIELAAFLGALGFLAVALLVPIWSVQLLGGVAVVLVVLCAWAYVIGYYVVQLQREQPIEIFRLMGARAAPIITLLALSLFITSLNGGDPLLHVVRTPGGTAATEGRLDLDTAFEQWLDATGDCDRELPVAGGGTVTARPLVLLATAGGGIRAAAWTTYTLAELDGACASKAVLLSSGVSGGSVGLAISRAPVNQRAHIVEDLAEPQGLGSAVAGLLVSDVIAAGSGLRIPSLSDGTWRWRDRVGLMEQAWIETLADDDRLDGDTTLTTAWTKEPTGPGGYLIFNSATTGNNCRVLISQLDLDLTPAPNQFAGGKLTPPSTAPSCGGLTGQPPVSFDLFEYYGRCTPAMDWLTASMLSARFPTVTPAARMPGVAPDTGCDDETASNLQLIDGGYAEGSGLGTLIDIAPRLLELIAEHNLELNRYEESVKAEQDKGQQAPRHPSYVVPLVLFVENHSGADVAPAQASLATEAFVPLAGRGAKELQVEPAAWLQRIAEQIADPCTGTSPDCDDAVRQLRVDLEDDTGGTDNSGIVVAAPSTQPAVAAPLGWTLSNDSIERLKDAVDGQTPPAGTSCPEPRPGGYTCLGRLLEVLDPPR